ncbi:MAG: argininosuccinate lyase [bacterium]|nr:argininosuccinate lyase [bacterium]
MKPKSSLDRKNPKPAGSRFSQDLYRGRLAAGPDPEITRFISSLKEDLRIAEADLAVNQVHSLLLQKAGILSARERKQILIGLGRARKEIERMRSSWPPPEIADNFVDIHPWIESYVIKSSGMEVGGKLHLGKSRNDQVVTDIRMVARSEILEIARELISLLSHLLAGAEKEKATVFPAFTHTQPAMITSYGHYLLAHFGALSRDLERLSEVYPRLNLLPLGAGATAGSRIRLDRNQAAGCLGFDGIIDNSTDAVSSRDLFLEIGAGLLSLAVNLSRMAADFILWSAPPSRMVELPDEYADTSSAMPQKKNPDPLEMVRGKAQLLLGIFTHLASAPAGLPSGYHKDFQDLKVSLFAGLDETRASLRVMNLIVPRMILHRRRMAELSAQSGIAALDLAEALAQKAGLPFREAHRLVGNLVRETQRHGVELGKADPSWVTGLPALLRRAGIKNLAVFLNPDELLRERKSLGGPSPAEITRVLRKGKLRIRKLQKEWEAREAKVQRSRRILDAQIRKLASR